MIEQVLASKDNSIEPRDTEIRNMAEAVRQNFYNGQRYGAFPQTSSDNNFPVDLNDVTPDNLDAKYSNEAVSLADLGVGTTEFNSVASKGFQYITGNGEIGFFIEWYTDATVQDQTDIDFMQSFGVNATIGQVYRFMKTTDYTSDKFDQGWKPIIEEENILP